MKNVLVVGGSGFLGSHVCDSLHGSGYKVRILDIKKSEYCRDEYDFIQGDMLDAKILNKAIKGCDYVYNFGGISDLNVALSKPIETVNVNIFGNVQLLDLCKKNKVQRYIYASTVYVNSKQGSFYRVSKNACEDYIEEYSKSFGLEYTILRYGSLYGDRSDKSNGLYRLVKNALDTGQVSYIGNIHSKREYVNVQDASDLSVEALSEKYKNTHLIISGLEQIGVKHLLNMLNEILGIEKDVIFEDQKYLGHYIRTPYALKNKLVKKIIPDSHIDFGQGLLQLISYIKNKQDFG
jgi:UDP-glucose 4-epimerase